MKLSLISVFARLVTPTRSLDGVVQIVAQRVRRVAPPSHLGQIAKKSNKLKSKSNEKTFIF